MPDLRRPADRAPDRLVWAVLLGGQLHGRRTLVREPRTGRLAANRRRKDPAGRSRRGSLGFRPRISGRQFQRLPAHAVHSAVQHVQPRPPARGSAARGKTSLSSAPQPVPHSNAPAGISEAGFRDSGSPASLPTFEPGVRHPDRPHRHPFPRRLWIVVCKRMASTKS
jgi:hypothetical protein